MGSVPVALMLPIVPVDRVPIAIAVPVPVFACVPASKPVAVSVSASVAIPVPASIPVPIPAPLSAAVAVAGAPPAAPGAVRRPPVRPLPGPRRHAALPVHMRKLLRIRKVMSGRSANSKGQCFLPNVSRRPSHKPSWERILACAHPLGPLMHRCGSELLSSMAAVHRDRLRTASLHACWGSSRRTSGCRSCASCSQCWCLSG